MKRKIAFALILIFVLLTVGLTACTPAAVAIEKVELTEVPKTVYEMGDSIDFGEAKLVVYYKNGASQIVDIAEKATVSGFYRNVAGEQIITVRYAEEYSYGETAFAVTVNRPKTVLSKTVVFPTVDYIKGQRINFSGATATVVYDKQYDNENITETFDLSEDNLISGDTSAIGKQTLEFLLYNDGEKDVTVSQEINVSDSTVRSVSLATLDAAPTKTAYALGDALDLSGLQLRLFMTTEVDAVVDTVVKSLNGGFTLQNAGGTVTATTADGSEFDTSFENTASLYINYQETETSEVLRTSGAITVRAVIRMPSTERGELPTYNPGVPTQVVNKPLGFGKAVMTVTFNDQTKVDYHLGDFDPTEENQHRTTGFDVRGFDINVSGQQTLRVVLYKPLAEEEGYSDEEYEISYNLVVNVAVERVESVAISDPQAEESEEYKSYVTEDDGEYYFRGYVGDVINLNDLEFTLVYNSGKIETAELSDLTVQGFGSTVGAVTAGSVYKLEAKGDDGYISIDTNGVSARINVVSRELAFKEFAFTEPSKLQYTHGENFSVSGAELAVLYADEEAADGDAVRVKRISESELLPLIDLSVFDTSVSGELKLTVTYGDKYVDQASVGFSVWVVTTVVNLEVGAAPTAVFVNGSSFERTGTGLKVRQIFSDGSAAVEITDFTDAAWTFSPSALTIDDAAALSGAVRVTVSYQGATAEFDVAVTNYYTGITEVDYIGSDEAKSFKVTEGMAIDLAQYRLTVLRQDGTFAYVTANGSDYDAENMTVGTRRVAISYTNSENTPSSLSFAVDFEVVQKQIDRYVVLGSVEHIHTKADASFVADGLSVRRYYDNGSYEVLTLGSEVLFDGYSLSGVADADYPVVLDITLKLPNEEAIDEFVFGGETVSSIKVTVYSKFAVSAVFCDVNGNPVNIPNLTLKQSSALNGTNGKLLTSSEVTGSGAAYDAWRDALDVLNAAYVVVTYTTGATEIISVGTSGFKAEGYESMRTGTQAVSLVSLADENVKVNFFVSVTARQALTVAWADGASIAAVKEGKALDQKLLFNAKLSVTYDFGEPEPVTATANMILDGGKVFNPADYVDGFGGSSSVTVPVKAVYAGIQTADTIDLTVERKKLTKIDIFGSPKTQYFEGEEFNFGESDFLKSSDGTDDLYLILYYDNDTSVSNAVKISMDMVDFSAYDNSEMTGQPKAQRILLSYTVEGKKLTYSYNVAMNDRANAIVQYNPNNAYVYTYGEQTDIAFDIMYKGSATEYSDSDVTAAFENERYSYRIAANGYIRTPINGGDGVTVAYLPAGNYTFRISYGGRAHTADTVGLNALVDNSHIVIIQQKQLEVSFDGEIDGEKLNDERIYDANKSYDSGFFVGFMSFSGFVGDEEREVLIGAPSVYVDGVILAGTVKHAGAYTVKIGGFNADNYSIVYLDESFNIAQREIYVALKDDGKIKVTYGASNVGLSERNGYFTVVDANGDALDIGEMLEGELLRNQEGLNADGQEVRGNKVGFYRIGIGTLQTMNHDYIVGIYGDSEPQFEIEKRELTVTVDDVEAVYGTSGIRLTLTFGEFYENDTAATALSGTPIYYIDDVTVNGGIVGLETVGTYTLSVDGYDSENYELIYETGEYTVSEKTITVYPLSNQGKIYGDSDGVFRYSVSGMLSGDELEGDLEREAGENVGSYAFNLGTLNNENYTLELAENAPEFVITEKPITVVLSDITKQYDGLTAAEKNEITEVCYDSDGEVYELEEGSYIISFVNAAAGIGNYGITLTDLDGNHEITLADSYSYSITPRKITVKFLTKLESEQEWTEFTSEDSFDYEYGNNRRRQMTVRYKLLDGDIGNEQLEETIALDNPMIYPTVSNGFTYDTVTGWYNVQNNGRWNVNANTVTDNNYSLDPTSATLNINKLEILIKPTTAALTATYTAGEQLAVREYEVNTTKENRIISLNEASYIKSILSLRVGGGGRQDVVENGYEVMFVLPSDANYIAKADKSVEPYFVSDYVNDHGGYDAERGVLRFVVNKRTVRVTIGEAALTKSYDAQEASIAAERLVLDIDDAALRTAVANALVYERLSAPEGVSGAVDSFASSDSGTFSVKIDNAHMTNGNYNAFFARSAVGLLVKNPDNPDGSYDKDDYYVYTIAKNTATVEVALNNGIRGRQFNNRELLSSDVAVNIIGYYPSTMTVSEILSKTGLTFAFSAENGADEDLIKVGDYGVEIDDYSDYNHEFTMSPTYRTFSITRLTVNVTVWDMYKRYDGKEPDEDGSKTFRLVTEQGEEKSVAVDDYTKGFDIAAQIYKNGVMTDLTVDDFPNCFVLKPEGVNCGLYPYEIVFPEASYPNYTFRISTTRDYEIKRAQIALGISDNESTYGMRFTDGFDIEQFGDYKVSNVNALKDMISFRYTDEDGNPVALSPSTPSGVYRVYAVTTAAEAEYTNYEFIVPENYFDGQNGGGYGYLTVLKAELSVTLTDFSWEYRREYTDRDDADGNFAGVNMPEMFAFSFPDGFELTGIDVTLLEGFRYPRFTEAFYEAFANISGGEFGAYIPVNAQSFIAETTTDAVNADYCFVFVNDARISVSHAPLTVETVRVTMDGTAVNQVSGTIDKEYGTIPTAEEIGIRYSGFRGEEFDGALWFNGNWYVIVGGAYIAATAEQQAEILGEENALLSSGAELPKFYEVKQVDVYGYVTETIGDSFYQQWKKIGWEPRVQLIYGYQSAGNRLAADVRSFESKNYSAVADPTFTYIVTRKALTATLSVSDEREALGDRVLKRTYDDHLKVGKDYFIDYGIDNGDGELVKGLVKIPGITVENRFDGHFANKPSAKPEENTDGVWVWNGSQWTHLTNGKEDSSGDIRFIYDYENGGFGKYYFVKDGANEYLYYIDSEGEFHALSASATVEDRPQTLFYDAAPTREWFNLNENTNKVNSGPAGTTPVSIELAGLYNSNYDITFERRGNNVYQIAIYNKIDYVMVGDSTLFATLVAEKGIESFIPIKVFYVDGTSSGVIKYYPNKTKGNQGSDFAKRIVIGDDDGNYDYSSDITGNQTLKVTYTEDNPLLPNGKDVAETYIVVRSYPSAPVTETGAMATASVGNPYTFGANSWRDVAGRTEFKQVFTAGAYDRVDMEFALKHTSNAKGEFETVVFDSNSRKLSLKIKTGEGERYKLYVVETINNGTPTEWEYHTYNMTESVYIDLFDGRAHLYTAYVNRLSHELTLVIDNSVIIRHSLRNETSIDPVTGLANIRFELEGQQGSFSNLNNNVNVWFAAANIQFNIISFKATRVGYENEMGITVLPNESASQTLYVTDEEPNATVFTKSAFFTVYGSYTDGTRVDYFINGKAVDRNSLSEELPEGLYRLTAKVVDTDQPEKVYSEAHFDLRVMRRAYEDGFQADVGTPTDGSPVTLKTDGLRFNSSDATSAEVLKNIDIYREYGVQVGRYYALLSEIAGTKYFSIVNNVRDDNDKYWSGSVNYTAYDGTTDLSLGGSDISLSANGISAITLDKRTAQISVTYTAGDATVTDSAVMNSVGTFYSGNVAEYGYYKMTFGIEKDAAATVDSENEYAAIINLKSNGFAANAFTETDTAYVGLSLGIKFGDNACTTEIALKSEGNIIGSATTTEIDWLTETQEKFTIEAYFDGTNSKITVNVYLGNDLKHTFEIKRSSSFNTSIDGVYIENEETISGWDRNNTLIKQFAKAEGGQSVILNGATLTVYGVEIGASSPVRRALYSLSREGGSGSSAAVATVPHSTEIPYQLRSDSTEVMAAMLSGGINGGYGESYNSYAVKFSFTPTGSIDTKIRFILAENITTDLTSQINAYQNENNFTATRAVALEYIDNGGTVEMWFTFMVANQTNVYRQLVYSGISDPNDFRYLSDGEVHTVAVNFYKGARELSNTDLVSRNVSSQNIDLYIDGIRYTVDGEGNYAENGTVKRFYFPNYNTLVNWKAVDGRTSGSSTINLSDKYFLDEYTSAGIAVTYGELKLYDMYVAKTAVDVAGGEAYFSQYGGLGTFFDR